MANKKLTTATIRTVKALRRKGHTYEEIAGKTGLSVGSISTALKGLETAAKAPTEVPKPSVEDSPEVAPAPAQAAPTRGELAELLGAQARQLATDLEGTKDLSARASLNRQLVAVQALLARVLPPPEPAAPEGYYVKAADMKGAARSAFTKIHNRGLAIVREHGAEVAATGASYTDLVLAYDRSPMTLLLAEVLDAHRQTEIGK